MTVWRAGIGDWERCDKKQAVQRPGVTPTQVARSAIWYAMVVGAWVAVVDSDWLVLWGPGTSWHRWYFFLAWGALSVRRVLCDLNTFARHTWWGGWETGVRAVTGQLPDNDG